MEILDHGEGGNAHCVERQVIRRSDPLDDIPPNSNFAQRLEPAIEDPLRRLVTLHVEAIGRSCAGIIVQVYRNPITRGFVFEVPGHVGLRAKQTFFLSSPQSYADGPARPRFHGHQDPHCFHSGSSSIGVVRGACSRMPRVQVRTHEHHLVAQHRIRAGNLGEDVVAVEVVLLKPGTHLDAQLDRHPARGAQAAGATGTGGDSRGVG